MQNYFLTILASLAVELKLTKQEELPYLGK